MPNYLDLFGSPNQSEGSCQDGMQVYINDVTKALSKANLGYANGISYRTKKLRLNEWERKKYKVKNRGVTALVQGTGNERDKRGFRKCYEKEGKL